MHKISSTPFLGILGFLLILILGIQLTTARKPQTPWQDTVVTQQPTSNGLSLNFTVYGSHTPKSVTHCENMDTLLAKSIVCKNFLIEEVLIQGEKNAIQVTMEGVAPPFPADFNMCYTVEGNNYWDFYSPDDYSLTLITDGRTNRLLQAEVISPAGELLIFKF